MKILITGVDGFLGKELVKLLKDDFELFKVSRRVDGDENSNTFIYDLANSNDFISILDSTNTDVIINLAATVDFKLTDFSSYFPVITVVPALIADWVRAKDKHLIHASTAVVHGIQLQKIKKISIYNPDTLYGRSKLWPDKLIQSSSCSHTILRFGGIFGVNGAFHLGIN